RPATLFVADFVGQVNALPGRIVERRADTMTVAVLGKTIDVPARTDLPQDVLVIVRPESLRVDAADGGSAGTVEEVEYRGDRVEYRVRLGDATIVAVEPAQGGQRRFAGGERVQVQLNAAALHLLPA